MREAPDIAEAVIVSLEDGKTGQSAPVRHSGTFGTSGSRKSQAWPRAA
jgi:hypothetical protein